MRSPLGAEGRLLGARTGLVAERGGASSPASGVVRPGMRYGLRYLAQMDQEAEDVLTELGIGRGGGVRWSARWKRGGAGVDRRRFSTKIHVRSGAEGGEEGLGDDPSPTVMLLSDLSGTPVQIGRASCRERVCELV